MRVPASFARAFVFAASLVGAIFVPTSSASALRCQHRIVDLGDSSTYVQALCGAPTSVSTRVMTRTQWGYVPGAIVGGASSTVAVPVEVWVYDFGPHRLMVELLFADGLLVDERTTHYGTPAGRPAP